MYTLYIKKEDMLELSHIPVIELFNEAANDDLVTFFQNLCQEIGSGYNYTNCYFWSELDDYDKTKIDYFNGICIENNEGDVVYLTYEQMLYYMKLVTERNIDTDESIHNKIADLLETFKLKFI